MLLDPAQLSTRDVYRHLIRLITPRPIAWVSTLSDDGVMNLAPFSFFNGVGSNPPSVVFCPANRRDGSPKDTLRNVESTGEFVVNIVSDRLSERMHATAAEFDSIVSEFEACGLTPCPSDRVCAPRVEEASAQLECELIQTIHLGAGPAGANLVIGRVVMMHIAEDVLDAEGLIDPERLDTIGRMGGIGYTRTRDRFELPPPQVR